MHLIFIFLQENVLGSSLVRHGRQKSAGRVHRVSRVLQCSDKAIKVLVQPRISRFHTGRVVDHVTYCSFDLVNQTSQCHIYVTFTQHAQGVPMHVDGKNTENPGILFVTKYNWNFSLKPPGYLLRTVEHHDRICGGRPDHGYRAQHGKTQASRA